MSRITFSRVLLSAAIASALIACQSMDHSDKSGAVSTDTATSAKRAYPSFAKSDAVDTYPNDVKVKDPFRGLEEIDSDATKAWIKAQNDVTNAELDKLELRDAFNSRLTELWNYERFGVPFKEGGRWFMSHNSGLQSQAVLKTMQNLSDEPKVLLDPNTLSADGTAALNSLSISPNGKYLAYAISQGGSDWQTWRIREIDTGKDLPDVIEWSKFSGASWLSDSSGFYYGAYAKPEGENVLKAANTNQKVYLHKLGQTSDALVFEQPNEPDQSAQLGETDDGNYLIASIGKGTDERNKVYIRDAKNPAKPWLKLIDVFEDSYGYVGNVGSVFYFLTTRDAPRYQLVSVDIAATKPEFKTVIAQSDATLGNVSLVGKSFIANYLRDARSEIKRVSLDGKKTTMIQLPGVGTANGFGGKMDQMETLFSFASFNRPGEIFRLDLNNDTVTSYRKPELKFNPDDFVTEQVFYPSKDGTKIPMFISYKKSIQRDGRTPTLLYGYGGFNISLQPSFSPAFLGWMDRGGIYAMANLRGGGEYGEAWHQAGMKTVKQNVFDDFAAAADYLIAEGYTAPKRIAINGRSNGGLLVAATQLQRPELFGAAIPAVGVLDMLRFNQFTIGKAWESDYGSPQTADEFKAIYQYSPLHNIKAGVDYPPTLVLTGDHDDRVYPAHSFKFAAQLQESYQGANPMLIRIETRGGHGAGKPTKMQIEENADWMAFAAHHIGLK
jgi:prolyl oligopeptidase